SCLADEELEMAVGEVRTLAGEEAVSSCLAGTSEGAEYVIALVNAGSAAAATLPVNVWVSGAEGFSGPPNPQHLPSPRDRAILPDERFHSSIREDGSAALESRLRSGGAVEVIGKPSLQLSPGEL